MAAPTGHRVAGAQGNAVGRGQEDRVCRKLGVSVEGPVAEGRDSSAASQAGSRQTAEAELPAAADLGENPGRGAVAAWLCHGPLDGAPGRGGDRKTVSGAVSPQPHVAALSGAGVELPEASEAGPGTQRSGDRVLEATRVATYKKRPESLGPIWSFSTRAASCSSLTSSAPGRRAGRPPGCRWRATGPKSRPSRRWGCPPNEGVWRCMCDSIPIRTFERRRWPSSFGTSCATSGAPWSCCGIGDGPTGPTPSNDCWPATGACTPIRSPATRPNLTPDEFVWTKLKRSVANSVPSDLGHLKRLLQPAVRRLRRSQRLLWSCIHASDLPWP